MKTPTGFRWGNQCSDNLRVGLLDHRDELTIIFIVDESPIFRRMITYLAEKMQHGAYRGSNSF